MAAGAEWLSQKCPYRDPCANRVNIMASQIRWEEYGIADSLRRAIPGVADRLPNLVHSAMHDVASPNRDSEVRIRNWFLCPALKTLRTTNLAAL